MKVSNLIQELSKCNADAEVLFVYSSQYNAKDKARNINTEHDIRSVKRHTDDVVYLSSMAL